MAQYHLEHLNRQDYLESVETIEDTKSIGFATMALHWWDRHFSWNHHGCIVLCDEESNHLSYIFYKIDSYKEYITIHNLFTPAILRRHGYAKKLLSMVFDQANDQYVKRFKFSSISQSLDFYINLGVIYWGVTSIGDYYCDLPMPIKGLDDLTTMISNKSTEELLGTKGSTILQKVEGNENMQTQIKQCQYDKDTSKLAKHYRLAELKAHSKECN